MSSKLKNQDRKLIKMGQKILKYPKIAEIGYTN